MVSSDFLYSRISEEMIEEFANAVATTDLRGITGRSLIPARTLWHVVLERVRLSFEISGADEFERGKELYDLARPIYKEVIKTFPQAYEAIIALTQADRVAIYDACHKYNGSNTGFTASRPIQKMDDKAAQKALKLISVSRIPARMTKYTEYPQTLFNKIQKYEDNELYKPNPAINRAEMVYDRVSADYDSAIIREIFTPLVDNLIKKSISANNRQKNMSRSDLEMTLIVGGYASGKSVMTEHFLSQQTTEKRKATLLVDPDDFKYPLFLSALEDGKMTDYDADVVHKESSYLAHMLKTSIIENFRIGSSPNLVFTSSVIGEEMFPAIFFHGRRTNIHYIHTSDDVAIESSLRRERKVAPEKIRGSIQLSAKSLLELNSSGYENARVYLYNRPAADKAPQPMAYIDVKSQEINIINLPAMRNLAASSDIFITASPDGSNVQALYGLTMHAIRGLKTKIPSILYVPDDENILRDLSKKYSEYAFFQHFFNYGFRINVLDPKDTTLVLASLIPYPEATFAMFLQPFNGSMECYTKDKAVHDWVAQFSYEKWPSERAEADKVLGTTNFTTLITSQREVRIKSEMTGFIR